MELHYAAARNDLETVRRLLKSTYRINRTPYGQPTALQFATSSPYTGVDMLKLLIERGATVDGATDLSGMSSLGMACKHGYLEKARFLLDAGANPNFQTESHSTPLIEGSRAPRQNRKAILSLLLEAGAHPNARTTYVESALKNVSSRGDFDCVALLLKSGADDTILNWSPLMRAIVFGKVADVANLVNETSIDERDHKQRTPWGLALAVGDVEKAKHIYAIDGTLYANDVFWSVRNDNPQMVEWLLSLGFPHDATNSHGQTLLMEAAQNGCVECVRHLIEAGFNVKAEGNFSERALHYAVESGSVEIVEMLVRARANINHINGEGYSPLRLAAASNDLPMVKSLLALGADPNANSDGYTPLYDAVNFDYYAIVKTLVDAGANPNLEVEYDWYPWMAVNTMETALLLLQANADFKRETVFGKAIFKTTSNPILQGIIKRRESH